MTQGNIDTNRECEKVYQRTRLVPSKSQCHLGKRKKGGIGEEGAVLD